MPLSTNCNFRLDFFSPSMCVSASPLFCAWKYDLLLECVANLIYLMWFRYGNAFSGGAGLYVRRDWGLSDQCICLFKEEEEKEWNLIDSVSPRILKKRERKSENQGDGRQSSWKSLGRKGGEKGKGTLKRLLLSLWHINSITVGRNRETINVI